MLELLEIMNAVSMIAAPSIGQVIEPKIKLNSKAHKIENTRNREKDTSSKEECNTLRKLVD